MPFGQRRAIFDLEHAVYVDTHTRRIINSGVGLRRELSAQLESLEAVADFSH